VVRAAGRACGDYCGGRPQALKRRNQQQKAAVIASGFCVLGPDIGCELTFQVRDLIFQQEFFLLEALQLQLVLSGFFSQSGYDIVEIAVFEVKIVDTLLKRIDNSLHGQAPPFGR
jgi:hypothetical protein